MRPLISGLAALACAAAAVAQEADIFGDDAVFVIEATPVEAVETAPLPAQTRLQVERLRAPPAPPPLLTPLVLPEADFATAAGEVEPNGKPELASPMSATVTARGELAQGDTDYFVFTITGEREAADTAALWAVEAIGESVLELGYLSAATGKVIQRQAQGAAAPDAHRFVLANLLLYPGEHRVWVRGTGSSPAAYRLRAVSLGPPDPAAEAEPNDDDSRAQALEFDQPRSGYLYTPLEQDVYYFHLPRETVVDLRIEPPSDIEATVTLGLSGPYGGGRAFLKDTLAAGSTPYERMRRLPPGAYALRLQARNAGSTVPYRILLRRAPLDMLPVDLEPNDEPAQAVPLPASHRVTGTPVQRGEQDWFALPELAPGTAISIVSAEEVDYGARRRVHVLAVGEALNSPGLVSYDEAANAWTGTVPHDMAPGTRYLLRIQAWLTDYDYQLSFSPGPARDDRGAPALDIAMAGGPLAVAAYVPDIQRLRIPVTVTSTSPEPQTVQVTSTASDPRWRVQQSTATLTLAPGASQTYDLGVTVPPDTGDLRPVRISTQLSHGGGTRAQHVDVAAICAVPPVDPAHAWPVPPALLGGFNVAAARFGANAVDGGRGVAELFDGRAPFDAGWAPLLGDATVTVDLAGDAPVSVRGVALNPRTTQALTTRPRRFTIDTSTDGETFVRRLEGELHALGEEQAFAFDAAVPASHVRLTLQDMQEAGAPVRRTSLGEFKVIAEPSSQPLGERRFNLADPRFGGHVVWSDPQAGRNPQTLLTEGSPDTARRRLDVARPNHWVIGFHHGRAAQITHLEWRQPPAQANTRTMSAVRVAVADSPLGPWTSLGQWTLNDAPESTSRFELPQATWARFVRITSTQADDAREWWRDAETLRIFERTAGPQYRSILAEWGHYAGAASHEFHVPTARRAEAAAQPGVAANGRRADAATLMPGQPVSGRVRVGETQAWYRLTIPPTDNRLTLDLATDGALRVRPSLLDASGGVVPLERIRRQDDGHLLFEAAVAPGANYHLRLVEPPRSVMFVWDNSASVTPYITQIYRTLARFAQGLTPGREEGNLLALGAGAPLLEPWARHPFELQRFLTNYDRRHVSSDSEAGMNVAARALSQRDGTRAVIHIADGLSGRGAQPPALWRTFVEAPIRVFPLELQGRSSTPWQQDVMQSWAAVDDGVYDYFGTAEDLEQGFARAACLIRRPADYRLLAITRHEAPPEPGTLEVLLAEDLPLNAVEIILDASGSMWAQIDGKARISIAHDVLAQLITGSIPPGTPLALRIFGHREARSCRTDLEVPLGPLQPDRLISAVRAAKPKERSKTPLAASLDAVASDLGRADGTKVVVLLTDGRETCDGDPAASIESLREAGLDVRLNIVGFAIDDDELAAEFERWSVLGGGRYFDADNETALAGAMQQALQPKFQVLDDSADVVAEGTAGGDPVTLPAGTYSVRLLTSPARQVDDVVIVPAGHRQLTVGQ